MNEIEELKRSMRRIIDSPDSTADEKERARRTLSELHAVVFRNLSSGSIREMERILNERRRK
jgi:hypothetical protein